MPLVLTRDGITSGTVNTSAQVFWKSAERTTALTLTAGAAYVDYITLSFTTTVVSNAVFILNLPVGYESGAIVGISRFVLNGTQLGNEMVCHRQTNNNTATSESPWQIINDLAAGTHTITAQMKMINGATLISPYSHNGSVARAVLLAGIYGS
jgi:ABC-type iron transport system FetAB permease component